LLKASTTTATSALLALAFACVVSTAGVAGENEHIWARHEGDPVVVARGGPRAVGRLGFRYENGFGVPQDYIAAVDLYRQAAEQGDAFAQAHLGLSYDKGHGVEKDIILAYKWLHLAAARAPRREHDFYQRLNDAVAQKMSLNQVAEGQRLALIWAANWQERHY
jgi:TPR repeat protein